MNSPIAKRDALSAKILSLLQAKDSEYTVENRLRQETFAGDRDARISLMGEDLTYCEVLGPINVTTATASRTALATTHKKRHRFEIFCWYRWKDADTYAQSSQQFFDDLLWDEDTGLLYQLENTSQLTDSGTGLTFTLSMPQEVLVTEVPIDQAAGEHAHYLNFKIDLIDA